MQQSRRAPMPPSMIPAPVGSRVGSHQSLSSTRPSARYPRSSLGSTSSSTAGRSRSSSATYPTSEMKVTERTAPMSKRTSTGSFQSLLRKPMSRSVTVPPDDAGYQSELEEQHSQSFDAVGSLRIRFDKSPQTSATFRALRIIEQRTGISSEFKNHEATTAEQTYRTRKERKVSMEDWSDDFDIAEEDECALQSESSQNISTLISNQDPMSTNFDGTVEEAMHDRVKYEPLAPPVDELSMIADAFLSQGGFTRCSSAEDVASRKRTQDDSLDIEEMMAEHPEFANSTQLLGKDDNLDFSTTSFQVWRDMPSSSSIDSFSESLILAPNLQNENCPFNRPPLQPKVVVQRQPSATHSRNIAPGEAGLDVPQIILQDATQRSMDPDSFPSQVFEAYPTGMPTLPIWIDGASFLAPLEDTEEGDCTELAGQDLFHEVQAQLANGLTDEGLVTSSPPRHFHHDYIATSGSDSRSNVHFSQSDGHSPVLEDNNSSEPTTVSTPGSIPSFEFASSLPHQQLEARQMASPVIYDDSNSFGAGGVAGSPAQAISTFMFSGRLPAPRPETYLGEDLDVGAIMRLEVAASRMLFDPQADTGATPVSVQAGAGATGVGLGMSIPHPSLMASSFPSVEHLASIPDFDEFSSSVPVVVLEQPSPVQSLFSEEEGQSLLDGLDLEDTILRSLPEPLTALSPEDARDWGRTIEVTEITPSPTAVVEMQQDITSSVVPTPVSSGMDETPALDGEIFNIDDAAELMDSREQCEEAIILPAPSSSTDVLRSGCYNSVDLSRKYMRPAPRAEATRVDHDISNVSESISGNLAVSKSVLQFSASGSHCIVKISGPPPPPPPPRPFGRPTARAVVDHKAIIEKLPRTTALHHYAVVEDAMEHKVAVISPDPALAFQHVAADEDVPCTLSPETGHTLAESQGKFGDFHACPTSPAVPASPAGRGLHNPLIPRPCVVDEISEHEKSPNLDTPASPAPSAPRSPRHRQSPNMTTSDGWESPGLSFWDSPRREKRVMLRQLFKRSSTSAGNAAASTDPSSGPNNISPVRPLFSRSRSRRSWFNGNNGDRSSTLAHESTPSSPPLSAAAPPAPPKTPKRRGLNFHWAARSRAPAPVAPSPSRSVRSQPDHAASPQTKSKGGRLGAVVHKFQALF